MSDKKFNLPPKSFFDRPFCLLCLAAAQKIAYAAHSLSRLGELHVKAGYVSTLLAGAPTLHVNRPLEKKIGSRRLHVATLDMNNWLNSSF